MSGGLGFRYSRFPAILCTGTDRDVIFYSVVLPIDIMLASVCTMMITVLWSVHRVSLVIINVKINSMIGNTAIAIASKLLVHVLCILKLFLEKVVSKH